jgi:DNA polymerase-3 subunit epsilon
MASSAAVDAPVGTPLRDLRVLVLDGQASGASPAHGDLLELAWGIVDAHGLHDLASHWIKPKTQRPIPKPIRKLLDWRDENLASALAAEEAWRRVLALAAPTTTSSVPTLIHWARFERPFLIDLHGGEPPLDVVCLHAIAERLFETLPKKNLRALAGHLGHSTSLVRNARGHVEATAFVWRAIVPRLEQAGIATWAELRTFVEQPRPKPAAFVFPFPAERRRALPDRPGVYRFLRSNGDVLYVGKAASLKKRVASHFQARVRKADALEMLTQVADVQVTETETALDAALLEVDEIHRLDPPYNVQLRVAERSAWFAARDFDDVVDAPDPAHPLGPLPSRRAVAGLAAMTKLRRGDEPSAALRAAACGVPEAFAPAPEAFAPIWADFAPAGPLLGAGLALHPYAEAEAETEDEELAWTPERIRRHLERTLAGESLLVRRARILALLVDAEVHFVDDGVERTLAPASAHPRPLALRKASFDARRYDRTRVLVTELLRVLEKGGTVLVRVGRHRLEARRLFATV